VLACSCTRSMAWMASVSTSRTPYFLARPACTSRCCSWALARQTFFSARRCSHSSSAIMPSLEQIRFCFCRAFLNGHEFYTYPGFFRTFRAQQDECAVGDQTQMCQEECLRKEWTTSHLKSVQMCCQASRSQYECLAEHGTCGRAISWPISAIGLSSAGLLGFPAGIPGFFLVRAQRILVTPGCVRSRRVSAALPCCMATTIHQSMLERSFRSLQIEAEALQNGSLLVKKSVVQQSYLGARQTRTL
jgi:hypothetical protein